MGKNKKKKEGLDKTVVESKSISSDKKEEKVSALGRYMKKVRAQEAASDDKSSENMLSRLK